YDSQNVGTIRPIEGGDFAAVASVARCKCCTECCRCHQSLMNSLQIICLIDKENEVIDCGPGEAIEIIVACSTMAILKQEEAKEEEQTSELLQEDIFSNLK
ncbi:hypothetical protein Tco_0446802, partial [Tanacetum coccineum]